MGSNSAGHFLLSWRAEGPAVERSPCCGRGAGGSTEVGDGVGADCRDGPARDLLAKGGANYFLKLDISEKKQTRVSSKAKIAKIQDYRPLHPYASQAEHRRAPPQLWLATARHP